MEDELLVEHCPFYLIKTRLENLEEKIDKTFDEIIEMQNLAHIADEDANHDSTPRVELRKLALIEAKRVNLTTEDYTDDIPELLDNKNEVYIELMKRSKFNAKSLKLITNQGKEVGKDVFKKWSFYRLYPPNPPKITLNDWINSEKNRQKGKVFSSQEMWQIKTKWENYCHERALKTSKSGQIITRIIELATSPIYKDMKKGQDIYELPCAITIKETAKTFIFTIPFKEFSDIPYAENAEHIVQYISFIEGAFILPEIAHERTRYFTKKGANLENFIAYLKALDVQVFPKLHNELYQRSTNKLLRFYRESLQQNKTHEKITGYFLAPLAGNYQLFNRMNEEIYNSIEKKAIFRHVLPGFTWYPQWMRKMGGVVIDPYFDEPVSVSYLQNSQRLYDEITKGIFAPSLELQKTSFAIPTDQFLCQYVEEMRNRYRENPQEFMRNAFSYCEAKRANGKNLPKAIYAEVLDKILTSVCEALNVR